MVDCFVVVENKFHYKIGNAEITINYPKSQVFVPSHGVSGMHEKKYLVKISVRKNNSFVDLKLQKTKT